MARPKGDAIKAVIYWASQQKQPFTIRQAYQVYTSNGGRENSEGDNLGSFTTQFQKYVAKDWKEGQTPKKGGAPYWPPSDRRPLMNAKRGGRGAADAHTFQWALNKPMSDPSTAKFINPDDDNNTGAAMDKLEKVMSRMGKGLPPDEKVGRQRLQAAIERWKKMKNLSQVVADIKATVPAKGQMDALHIASEFLMDKGAVDQDDVEDAEQEVEPEAPEQDDDDVGDFSDDPDGDDDLGMDFDDLTGDEPEAPAPAAPSAPTPVPATPEPEDDDDLGMDFTDLGDEEDDVEPTTKSQAGAQSFLKPTPPTAPKAAPQRPAAPTPPPKKSRLSPFFKKK